MSNYPRLAVSFLSFLIIAATIVKADPIAVGCGSVASDTSYQAVQQVLSALYDTTSESGFIVMELGDLFGYALCRGDVDSTNCHYCIQMAVYDIQVYCPTSQAAAIYYDYCDLRYQLDRYPYDSNIYYCQAGDTQVDPDRLNPILSYLFQQLVLLAPLQPRYFAFGSVNGGDKPTFYGYVQCFNDMPGNDCWKCLDDLSRQLPTACTGGRAGGRLVGGSCLLRYENYNFLEQ